MPHNNPSNAKSGQERRRSKRRPVLDTFSLFVVVPKKGVHRLQIHDISEAGLGFDLDIEGENFDEFPIRPKEKLDVQLYLNQSLYLDLPVTVARIEDGGGVRRIGAEFSDRGSPGYQGLAAFVKMLDALTETGRISA